MPARAKRGATARRPNASHMSVVRPSFDLAFCRFSPDLLILPCSWRAPRRTLGAMCEILQCGGGGEELLAEPCVSAHCSQTAVRQEDKAVWNNREFMWAVRSRRERFVTPCLHTMNMLANMFMV
jgi:hypothetical protein